MRISTKAITTYNSVNSFNYGNQWAIRAGEPNTLYFQLIDIDQVGLRYIPSLGAVISVTFPSIDDSKIITVTATAADAADRSLLKIDLTELQSPYSGNVSFSITEGSITRKFQVLNLISVEYPNSGSY